MVSSARQAIVCILLIFGTVVSARSQAAPEKNTSNISGKVTIKGKGAPGIVVVAVDAKDGGGWNALRVNRRRATTDQTGNYRITNIPAGAYHVSPITPALVVENDKISNAVVIEDGETLEDINFSLVRGGVITGKITDSEGEPLIEEQVNVEPLGDQSGPTRFNGMTRLQGMSTDDRGVYRAFGLPQGKYKVSVGQAEDRFYQRSRQVYRQTFYPAVTDPAKATVIEVTEGSETNDIDIVTGPAATTFKASGRIVDAETGKPLPNIEYGVSYIRENSETSTSGTTSNANGEFKLENVLPGKYMIFITPSEKTELRPESLTFHVIDRDVTGLMIKASRGASLSGVLVWEGSDEKSALARLSKVPIFALIRNDTSNYHHSQHGIPNPDGSFKIAGLQSGVAHFSFGYSDRESQVIEIVRVERNGVPQPDGINLKDGEQLTGIRLVVKYVSLTGSIRGQVKVENGELPKSSQMMVQVSFVENDPGGKPIDTGNQQVEVDVRGRFVVQGLAAGTYQVRLMLFGPMRMNGEDVSTQVTVTENTVSEVNLTLKLKPGPGNP
jgi:hypothetical protein